MTLLRTLLMVLSLIALAGCASPNPAANMPAGSTFDRAEDIGTPVKLELYHETDLPIGAGFSVYISGWEPNDFIEVFAYDVNGVKHDVVAGETRLPVSPEGEVSFSLPYHFHAFRPGQWLIVVSGKSGEHAHYVDIPNEEK